MHGGYCKVEKAVQHQRQHQSGDSAQKAQQEARDESERQFAASDAQYDAVISELQTHLLKRNTVEPGKMCAGQIDFAMPKVDKDETVTLNISIKTGEDTHEMEFTVLGTK